MTTTIHVVHGDKPKLKKGNEFSIFVFHTARMKVLIGENPKITDKELCIKLGLDFSKLQDMKTFCKINGMRINEP